MSFKSETYRVMIASPSDMAEERVAAEQAVHDWNQMHAVAEGVVLLPVRWETHATPVSGVRPQDAVNQQLVKESDILIGMFWTKLGTRTGAAESGTVEEIDQFVAAKKPALLYFSARPIDPSKIDIDQHKKLKQFKEETYKTALAGTFTHPDELRTQLLFHLTHHVRQLRAAKPLPDEQRRQQKEQAQRETEKHAAEERKALELKLIDNQWRIFRAKRGIVALTIVPYNLPSKPLDLGEPFLSKYRQLFIPMGTSAGDYKPTPHSVLTRYHDGDPLEEHSMSELTTAGTIFSVHQWDEANDGNDVVGFPMYLYEPIIIHAIRRYLTLLNDLLVKGPWWVGLSLLKVRGFQLHPNRTVFAPRLQAPCDEEHIVTDAMKIDAAIDLSDPNLIAKTLRPQLDQLWRGFGYLSDRFFAETGDYAFDLRKQ